MHTPESLLANLTQQGITYTLHHHAPVFTVAESHAITSQIPGAHTKNLFVKDKAGTLWLITSEQHRALNLKTLGKHLGAKDRLSFTNEDTLWHHLGVKPGSVTPMGLINTQPGAIRFVLDALILEADQVSVHPLQNDQTLTLTPQSLVNALKTWGHETTPLNLGLFPREA